MTMSEAERLSRLFCENLNYYMDLKDRSQADLARALDVSTSSVSYWLTGQRVPRMNMIAKIAIWLGIEPHDLITERKEEGYYLNAESKEIANAVAKDSDLRLLFSAARSASPEELQLAINMLKMMKRKEDGDDYDGIDEIRDTDDFEG